jgi:DNA-binding NarL/FixJ family response regulator
MENTDSKHKITVALADDHSVFREGVARLLELEDDIEIVGTASDGREVLKLLKSVEPDVLLLDLRMPNLDGLGALKKLATKELRTRIIVLTASEDQVQFVQAISGGASAVVLKPSASRCLPDCIRAVHAGELWLDDKALPLPDGSSSPLIPVG